MRGPEDFSSCPFCGSDVKLKNMLNHKLEVHGEEMDTEEEKSPRELEMVTDEELKVASDEASNMMSEGKFREAADFFRKVLKADPSNFGAWNDLGLCLVKLNEADEALESFERAIEVNPEFAHAWLQKGNLLFTVKEEVNEAKKCYEEATELDPKLIQAWHNLGNVHLKKKNYEKAIRCFDKAIELNDEYYMAWLSKSHALDYLDRSEEAEKCFEKAYDLNPGYVQRFTTSQIGGGGTFQEASGMRADEDEDKE